MVIALSIAPKPPTTSNDGSHLALGLSLSEGRVALEQYAGYASIDHAVRDGVIYSDRAPGLALLLAPLLWLGWDPRLLPAAAYGATLAVMYGWMRRDGCSVAAASATSVLTGATLMLRYAPVLFAHTLAGFLLTLGARLVTGRTRHGWAVGLLVGWAGITEYGLALLAIAGSLVAWRVRPSWYVGLAVPVSAAALYHWAAFGAPWRTSQAYQASFDAARSLGGTFGGPLWAGMHSFVWYGYDAWGFRNWGLIVLSPVIVLAPLGLLAYGLRFRWQAALLAVVCVGYMTLYSMHVAFGAGTSDSRYFVPFLPLALMGLGHLFTVVGWPAWFVGAILGLTGIERLLWHIQNSDGWGGQLAMHWPF
jgi:hypothetical protein